MKRCHILGYKNINLFLIPLEAEKYETQMLADLVSGGSLSRDSVTLSLSLAG